MELHCEGCVVGKVVKGRCGDKVEGGELAVRMWEDVRMILAEVDKIVGWNAEMRGSCNPCWCRTVAIYWPGKKILLMTQKAKCR